MKYAGIPYEGLDSQGFPVIREAKVIGELPTPEMRGQACAEAAAVLGAKLGLNVVRSIPFGAPVYEAFGMRRPDAKKHAESDLLLKLGCDVPLEFCCQQRNVS